MSKLSKLVLPALLLAGCNSSGTGGVLAPVSEPNYATLDSTEPGITALAGTSLTLESSGDLVTRHSSGSLNRTTGRSELDDGRYAFVDPDGATDGGFATDGNAIVRLVSLGDGYQYVRGYTAEYSKDGGADNVIGFVGNPTRAQDLPASGTAVYRGEAASGYVDKTSFLGSFAAEGDATVTADFGSGTVDVRSQFKSFDGEFVPITDPAYDEIERTGMRMSGGRFSGGNVVFKKNGSVVTPLGSIQHSEAKGQFYGGERAGSGTRPAEVAGVSVVEGTDGVVFNTFFGR